MPAFDYSQLPILISLIAILIGLTLRGLWLWTSLTFAVLFLYVFDRDSIVTLVIYLLTASLFIQGYIQIKRGYQNSQQLGKTDKFTFAVDGNNLLGLVDWELDRFLEFINELERDGLKTHLFFDYSIRRTLKENDLMIPNETVPMAVCRVMDRDRSNVTVSKKGYGADALLIRYADRERITVLSNDKFNKSNEDRFIQKAVRRLERQNLIRRVDLVENKLTIM